MATLTQKYEIGPLSCKRFKKKQWDTNPHVLRHITTNSKAFLSSGCQTYDAEFDVEFELELEVELEVELGESLSRSLGQVGFVGTLNGTYSVCDAPTSLH
ncbi:1502_t:CDS:2 [Acaulospora colombiana]|uniref:1502_t:CDS:1 n=1 Tax=Acaulospora colombiana TaxID=27376 RepID=A0ACA9K5S6_9GLOM|nr:1502_t:CDS:2 [Acaulospora colombiana]